MRFDVIESTNDEALRQAKLGVSEGYCVVADKQIAGRGRKGRKWHSEEGGLYFSIVLRPSIGPRYLPVLTLVCAIAVYETVRQFCRTDPDIKWPNDILVSGKKISGILAETCETEKGTAVVVGIGINMEIKNMPDEVRNSATSILDETDEPADKEKVLRTLSGFLTEGYANFKSPSDVEKVLGEWSKRSSYANGRKVSVRKGKETLKGITAGLDKNGSLLVKMADGQLKTVTAGDIESVRPVRAA